MEMLSRPHMGSKKHHLKYLFLNFCMIFQCTCFSKAQSIISAHIDHRRAERFEDPQRFNRKPTLGELAPRKAPPPSQVVEQISQEGSSSPSQQPASQSQTSRKLILPSNQPVE